MSKQKQVIVKMSEEFLAEIDAALPGMGYGDRASFIRDAVFDELKKNGVKVDPGLKAAPSRAGKGGTPTHKKKVYDLKKKAPAMVAEEMACTLPYLGAVAAGSPVADEFAEEVTVGRQYPKGHFVVRVSGESMEPELSDGDLIVVDARDVFTPGTGRVCVVSCGGGSSVKRWNRKRGVFESLNDEFPDLEPGEDFVFQGYFVEKVEV